MIIPIKSNVAHELSGFFVAAASPRLKFDEQYRSFLELAAAQIAAAISTARAYEAERQRAEALAEIDRAKTLFFSNVSHEFRTLLADDNADMRAYVRRLLEPHCDVETVPDGQAAIEVIRDQLPDLVLADVMMPRLDGLGLVHAIRADPATANLPVILLSARAGEEAKVQGLNAGADDYLVKPFSGRELIARVRVHVNLAKLRKHTAADLRDMQRLHQVAKQCARMEKQLTGCLDEILDAAIAITEADKGTIQLFDSDRGCLNIAAQRGFEPGFLQYFAQVRPDKATVSGRALQTFDRVIVEHVTRSEIFAGGDAADVLLSAGVRALQSTPLVSSEGAILGMIPRILASRIASPSDSCACSTCLPGRRPIIWSENRTSGFASAPRRRCNVRPRSSRA